MKIESRDIILGRNPRTYSRGREVKGYKAWVSGGSGPSFPTRDPLYPFWDAGLGEILEDEISWKHVVEFGSRIPFDVSGEWIKPYDFRHPIDKRTFLKPRWRDLSYGGAIIPPQIDSELRRNKGFTRKFKNSKTKNVFFKVEYVGRK
jgi:hypothetical protein